MAAAGSAVGSGVAGEGPGESPTSQVSVCGRIGRALRDSGSQLNLVSSAFCRAVGAALQPPSGVVLQSISGATVTPIGQVMLPVVPVDAAVGGPIFIMFHVVDTLPQQFDMIMHAPALSKQQFWSWRARKSRQLISKTELAIHAKQFRSRNQFAALTAVMVAVTAAAALPPGPYEFAKQREELAAEFADPTLEERVADSVAAPAVDLATAPLQVPTETTAAEVDALRATLVEFSGAFRWQPEGVLMEPMRLPVIEGKRPVASAGHARHVANVDKRQALEEHVAKLIAKGVIRPCAPDSDKTYSGQVVMAHKPGSPGEYRFCVDFRQYNDVAAADARGFPTVGESIASLEGCTLFFSLDLMAGFHQIPVAEEDKYKLRFVTHLGDFEFNFVPFGITNGPTFCQTLMESVNRDLIGRRVVSIYVDDFAGGDRVAAPAGAGAGDADADWVAPAGIRAGWAEMLRNLRRVLRRAVERRLVFTLHKCRFGFTEHRWLGQLVTAEGRRVDPARFDGLRSMPLPQTKAQLVSFVALASYFREFVPNMAEKLLPFAELQKHNARFDWQPHHTAAFRAVIDSIITAGTLVNLDWNHPFVVQVDASKYAIGAVLLTGPPDALRPYAFISRKLLDAETRYNVTEKECLAMHWAVTEKWAEILWGRPFFLHTDHKNLTYMLASENERVRRWVSSMSRFRFQASHIPGSTNSVADGLSRVGLDPLQRLVAAALATTNSRADDAAGKEGQGNGSDGVTSTSSDEAPTRQQLQHNFNMLNALAAAQKSMGATERRKWTKDPHCREVTHGDLVLLAKDLPGDGWAYIIPAGQEAAAIRAEALRLAHDVDTAAHGGVERTVLRLHSGHVTWATIQQDVQQHVRSCAACQKHKPPTAQQHHAYMRHVGAQRTWERVVMDLLQLPRGNDGATHVLVAVDAFTRYAVARALPDATAVSVLKALGESVYAFGYPEIIQTDNGSSFDNLAFTAQMQRLGIAYHRTVPYHHESQGAVERVNRTLLNMLRPVIDGNSGRWEDALSAAVLAYNTAVHEAIGMSPHAAMFRHPINSALSLRFSGSAGGIMEPHSAARSVGQVVASSDADTPLLYDSIRRQQAAYVKLRKDRFDKLVSPVKFDAGDMVWVFDERRPHKLAAQWTGPFQIVSRHAENANLYMVSPPVESGSRKRDADPVVKHVDHLRRADTSRMSADDILYSAARPDTNIVEAVIGHKGTSSKNYQFLILWRGEGALRATWEPLVGRTVDGKPSGVGKVALVQEYMIQHNLVPTAESNKGRRVTSKR